MYVKSIKRGWSLQAAFRQNKPYRSWFEFLRLADKDPKITIDEVSYEDWGDYINQKFSD